MLQVRDIHCAYDSSVVLRGISLDVTAGEAVGILGRNGVGKSTIMRAALGPTPTTLRRHHR